MTASVFNFATRSGSPQEHMSITVGPYYLTHPVNFPCGKKPEYSKKAHDFRQSLTYTIFPTDLDLLLKVEPAKTSGLTTRPPKSS